MEFQIFMQTLHLHLGANRVSIYSLNLLEDVSDLASPGNWVHIVGPNVFRLLAPHEMVLWCLSRMSSRILTFFSWLSLQSDITIASVLSQQYNWKTFTILTP